MLIKKTGLIKEILAGDFTLLKEVFHPEKENANLPYSLALARLEPGKSSLPHRLINSELYIFISGKGIFHMEQEAQIIEDGDLVLVPENKTQFVENTGKNDLVFYCIVSPPWNEADEKIEELP